jgi:hypothetical protein
MDDEGIRLDAVVGAGLATNLRSGPTLARSAVRLLDSPGPDAHPLARAWRTGLSSEDLQSAAFAACCEYARSTADPEALARTQTLVRRLDADVEAATRVLELRMFVLLARAGEESEARRGELLRGAESERLAGYERVAIFAGAGKAGGAMSEGALEMLGKLLGPRETRLATAQAGTASPSEACASSHLDAWDLLPEARRFQALQNFDGVVLGGGTASGVSGVVGSAARGYAVPAIGYVPRGLGDRERYSGIRVTDGHDFSVREPLAMWTDILAAGISPEQVSLVACPGGPITRAEILLARALGARVGWLDPGGEAVLPLDDDLPGGAEDIVELPADAMAIRALISWTELDDPALRDHVAQLSHASYRSKQSAEKLASDPACAPWERLLPIFRASTRAQADDIENKLAMIGLRIERIGAGGRDLVLSEDEIILLAEMEHGRYVVERLRAGWELGDRDANRGRSPYVGVPWTELTQEERSWDVAAVTMIPGALASFGYGVTELAD